MRLVLRTICIVEERLFLDAATPSKRENESILAEILSAAAGIKSAAQKTPNTELKGPRSKPATHVYSMGTGELI